MRRSGTMRRQAGAAVLVLAVALAAAARADDPSCPPGLDNLPRDTDGDGEPDLVCVADFDGDAVLETDDVQDAVDSLTDPGPKLVVVLPGDFQPPAEPFFRSGRQFGLVELGSDTTLRCSGVGQTRLRASPETDYFHDYAVVSNRDHWLGNDRVVVRDCELDGAAPPVYDSQGVSLNQRMGVYFRWTRDAVVEDSFVHDTYHTGLYTSNSTRDAFQNNVVERAGGWGDVAPWDERRMYPCVYLYAFGPSGAVDGMNAVGNTLRRCGNAGLMTRANHLDGWPNVIRNLLWQGNLVEDTGSASGDAEHRGSDGSFCMALRGVDGASLVDNACRSTGAFTISNLGTAYRSAGDENASSNVAVEGLVVTDAEFSAGVVLGRYTDGVSLRDVVVDGTRDDAGTYLDLPCLAFETPLRNASFERIELRRCGGGGFFELGTGGSGRTPDERLVIRDLLVEEVDLAHPLDYLLRAAVWLRGAHDGLLLERIEARHATYPEIYFAGPITNATLRDVEVDSVDPGWLGAVREGQVPACTAALEERWLTTTDAASLTDCDFASGTGSQTSRCRCQGGAWVYSALTNYSSGIELNDGGTPSSNVRLENVRVANVRDRTGIRVERVAGVTALGVVGLDDSPATEVPQDSAILFVDSPSPPVVTGATCVGTDPGRPCVEFEGGVPPSVDSDSDGMLDATDDCITVPNPDQRDTDGDGFGNACDPDLNGDGIVNLADLAALKQVFFRPNANADLNGDGLVNLPDLAILKQWFLRAPGPSGVAP